MSALHRYASGAGVAGALALGGCDLRFAEPRALWLLWLVPVVAAFFAWSIGRRARLATRLVAPRLVESLARGHSPRRLWLKATLVLVAVAALALALARPRYGFAWEDARRRGVDLVVALDVSDSMLATDDPSGGSATRLERARRKIADLLAELGGDRVAIVPFAGAAFVACPLTLDHAAARSFIDAMGPDVISAKGTSVAGAIRASLRAFDGGNESSRAILLVSDGEATTDAALDAAREAAESGVRIYTLGVGGTDGAPIPRADGSFRRDRKGELVLSRLDESALRDVALATGGLYVRSVPGDGDLTALYRRGIQAALEKRDLGSERTRRWHERYQWLVGVALVALAAELLVPERARRSHHA